MEYIPYTDRYRQYALPSTVDILRSYRIRCECWLLQSTNQLIILIGSNNRILLHRMRLEHPRAVRTQYVHRTRLDILPIYVGVQNFDILGIHPLWMCAQLIAIQTSYADKYNAVTLDSMLAYTYSKLNLHSSLLSLLRIYSTLYSSDWVHTKKSPN